MPYVVQCVTKKTLGGFDVEPIGEYPELTDAINAAMRVIDTFLSSQYTKGISAEKLFEIYKQIGQVPYIFGGAGTTTQISGFNHFEYSMRRCKEIARDQ